MLAANEAVAARLSDAGAGALFRIHEPPDPERVEEFCELVASFGYRVPATLDGVRPEDFQLVLRQIEGKPEEKLVVVPAASHHEAGALPRGEPGALRSGHRACTPTSRAPSAAIRTSSCTARCGPCGRARARRRGRAAAGAARDGPPPLRDGASSRRRPSASWWSGRRSASWPTSWARSSPAT